MARPYYVYKNDLKYRDTWPINDSDIKNNMIRNIDDIREHLGVNMNTLEYRIKECITENDHSLDLSYLNMKFIPDTLNIPDHVTIVDLSNNDLESIPDRITRDIQVLNISNNRLDELPYMPYIEELKCTNNKLRDISSLKDSTRLHRVDISKNNIDNISKLPPSLRVLIADDNNIVHIPEFIYLEELSCNRNRLKTVSRLDKLKFMTVMNNEIESLPDMPSLISLYCSHNNMKSLPMAMMLNIVSCESNDIDKICYYPSLTRIVCDINKIKKLSSRLKIKTKKLLIDRGDRQYGLYEFNI